MPVSELARGALLLAALALAPGVQAQGNFREAYARGKEAAANSRWAEVEARMREAIAAEPTPQARVRIYGMRFEPYVPQYFLGLAAYRQGNCAEAQRQWSHGPTASILDGDATLKGVVEQGLADCRKRQPQLAQQPATPAQPAANPAAPPASTPAPVAQRDPPPATTQRPAAPPATEPARPPAATTQRPPSAAPSPAPAPAATSSAPPALVAALDAWIAGRLDGPANLDLAPFTDPKARFHALLLRSAARHALSQAGGERAAALLAGAQADIRAARALVPGQSPDAALFSPRYRRLFDATR